MNVSGLVWYSLVCPICRHKIEDVNSICKCPLCEVEYGHTSSGALDLRPKSSTKFSLDFQIGPQPFDSSPSNGVLKLLRCNPIMEIAPPRSELPRHFTRELISWFPKARNQDNLALDLGCGDMIHKDLCEYAGFEYVGLDYDSECAQILGDAHLLPFADNSFDLVLSFGVFEHLCFPFVAIREIQRVLKPGGKLMGTVAFMEPFHGQSYYHHTHLGLYNLLKFGDFEIQFISPRSESWSALTALARMGLFPKMPKSFARAIVFPIQAAHKLWWRIGQLLGRNLDETFRIVQTTGAFVFLAHKQ